jgi:outer membrane receptor protein involved in Fe transport
MHTTWARNLLACSTALTALIATTPAFAANRAEAAKVADAPVAPVQEGGAGEPESGRDAAGDIVITANKRPESVRKISGSVTALTNDALEEIGADSARDYLGFVPGVILNAGGTVTVRGVSTTTGADQGQGATGYFINDVPLTEPYYQIGVPDIDAFDVDNVAVLRGPQGTLFGSASLGGAINYQAAPPQLDGYHARGEAWLMSVDHGDVGGALKGALNIPIIKDELAVRGTFVYREDPGFIDNVTTGERDVNRHVVQGGRVQVRWEPMVGTKVNYLYLDQTDKDYGSDSDRPGRDGELRNASVFSGRGSFRTILHNVRLDQDLGFATFTATATRHVKTRTSLTDLTDSYSAYIPGVVPLSATSNYSAKGYTFETRLVSKPGRFEYIVGAMYDRTKERFVDLYSGPGAAASIEANWADTFGAGVGALSAPNDVFFTSRLPFNGEEMAFFGEGTFHFNDQLKLTAGGRLFRTRAENSAYSQGFFLLFSGASLEQNLSGKQSSSGFNPKVSLTWTPNKDFMAYGLISKGFRFGGPNVNAAVPGVDIPKTFKPDSLINYEIGTRATMFNGGLLLDVSAFYIDWKDIQLRLGTPSGLAYGSNASKAGNFGVELASTINPTRELSFRTAVTFLDAKIKRAFDPGAGSPIVPAGATLPGASKWKVSNIASYTLEDVALEPSLVLTHQYTSKATTDFAFGVPVGGYSLFGARLALHPRRDISFTLYAENLFDKRGATGGIFGETYDTYVRTVERPRTIGAILRFDIR